MRGKDIQEQLIIWQPYSVEKEGLKMEKNMQYYVRISGDVMLKNVNERKILTKSLCEKYLESGKKDICIIASGSSLNAAMSAELFMTKYIGVNVFTISPTEYLNYRKELVRDCFFIIISQSGCSTNIIEAVDDMNNEGIEYVAVTGNIDGDLKEYSSNLIEYGVGNETVGYVTLGMTTLIEFLILLATEVSYAKENIEIKEYEKIIDNIKVCCRLNKEAYTLAETFTKKYYEDLFKMDRAIIVADGANMGIAREAGLKFSETLKIPTVYYESEEYAHGPNMQLTPEYSVFFIDTNHKTNRMQDVFKATEDVVRHAYMVTDKSIHEGENVLQFKEEVPSELTPLYTAVLFQYICANVTREKNNFKCHPYFERFEKRIHTKTKKYEEMHKGE